MAEQRLVLQVDVFEKLKKLSNKHLVEIALIGALDELSPTAQAVVLELCARLEPNFESDETLGRGLPREDSLVCDVVRHYVAGMAQIARSLKAQGF